MSTAAARVSLEPLREAVFDPFENDMGESSTQRFISEDLRPQIEVELAEQGRAMFVGADQYIARDPNDPEAVIAPDVYTLPGSSPASRSIAGRCGRRASSRASRSRWSPSARRKTTTRSLRCTTCSGCVIS